MGRDLPPAATLALLLLLLGTCAGISIPRPPRRISDEGGVPQQVHVTQGKHPGTLIVSWATDAPSVSEVHYGPAPGKYLWKAAGKASQYTRGAYTSPHLHHVKLTGLNASTTYYYAVGDASVEAGGGLRELSVTTLPAVGGGQSLTFTVIGDLGQTEFSQSTVMHVLADPEQQATIIAGDLSYADGNQSRWDRWGALFEPLLSSRVFQPAVGNHEIEIKDKDRGSLRQLRLGREAGGWDYTPFLAYQARFVHSGPDEPRGLGMSSSLYYSYSAGPAHFLHLASYAPFGDGSEQKVWLEKELASVDRARTPWVFAVVHAPWYNSNKAHQGEVEEAEMRQSMEGMLCRGGVDAVFAGHVHAYERVGPSLNGTLREGGITYINVGDGGNREGLAVQYIDPQPEWSVVRQASYGHGKVRIINGTRAFWTWHRIQDGEVVAHDELELPHTRPGACAGGA
mmetsp:Transcript_21244/g.53472  ORF Transcript_21244/g.53472 Transcript_21244/m.53472 type:complete len:454 (-) Transcript_21244:7-1368(-)